MLMPPKFPLSWPEGWAKTPIAQRKKAHFQGDWNKAITELNKIVNNIVGLKYYQSDYPQPVVNTSYNFGDLTFHEIKTITESASIVMPEVVVSFMKYKKGKNGRPEKVIVTFGCDKWLRLRDNLKAINASLMAMEKISGWGCDQMLEKAWTAFEGPLLGAPKKWWDILDLGYDQKNITKDAIQSAWKRKAIKLHPDVGGFGEAMAELNNARDEAFQYFKDYLED